MKNILICFLIFCANSLFAQNEIKTIQFDNDIESKVFKICDIDSITYSADFNIEYQNIWIGGSSYKSDITSISDVSFVNVSNEYTFIEEPDKGRSGVVSKSGDYCAIIIDSISSRSLAIFGNYFSDYKDYASIDSLGMINHLSINNIVYSMLYGEESIAVYENGKWICDIPYDVFNYNIAKSKNIHKASILTRNPIYNLLSFISTVKGYLTSPLKSALFDLLRSQLGGNSDDWLNISLNFLDGIDPTDLLDTIDKVIDSNYFGDAFIHTLDPVELSMTKYRLGCNFRLPSKDTPFYTENAYRGINFFFTVGMNLHEDIIMGQNEYQEKESLDEEAWFDFSKLNVETSYTFEPMLNVEYSISDRAYWLSINKDPDKIGPIKEKRTIYGDAKKFYIGPIRSEVGEASNVSCTKATIECKYSNIPDNAECGVEISCPSSNEVFKVRNGTGEGSHSVNVSGLKPNTTYAYVAYVTYKGKDYISWNGGVLKTATPSATTGSVSEVTDRTAKVKCSFNTAEDFECGIMVSDNEGTKKFTASSIEGEQEIELTGLNPYTNYNYWAYVEVEGVPINGGTKSFTTKFPDITGTWKCKEAQYDAAGNIKSYESYTITLHDNGTATINKNGFNYINARWSGGPEININADIIATNTFNHGRVWKGTVDNPKNPQKYTGHTYSWNYNQYGYFQGDGYYIELTR